MSEIENFLWPVRWDFDWKKFWKKNFQKKNGGKWDISVFPRTRFPIFPSFSEKLMAENGLQRVFLHIYSFRIFFQAVFYHFSAFSQNVLTLVESHPMSLIGHNSGCLRSRGLKILGFSCLSVIKTCQPLLFWQRKTRKELINFLRSYYRFFGSLITNFWVVY